MLPTFSSHKPILHFRVFPMQHPNKSNLGLSRYLWLQVTNKQTKPLKLSGKGWEMYQLVEYKQQEVERAFRNCWNVVWFPSPSPSYCLALQTNRKEADNSLSPNPKILQKGPACVRCPPLGQAAMPKMVVQPCGQGVGFKRRSRTLQEDYPINVHCQKKKKKGRIPTLSCLSQCHSGNDVTFQFSCPQFAEPACKGSGNSPRSLQLLQMLQDSKPKKIGEKVLGSCRLNLKAGG